jgi:hypothetical protein
VPRSAIVDRRRNLAPVDIEQVLLIHREVLRGVRGHRREISKPSEPDRFAAF